MDVPIKHVIGTVALIALVIAVGLSYGIVTSYIETDVLKQQLKQISENVALNVVEIVNLVNFGDFLSKSISQVTAKAIDLPSAGKAYAVQLVYETEESEGYSVCTYLLARKDIKASSPIPFNSSQTRLIIYTGPDAFVRDTGGGKYTIECSGVVYGGAENRTDSVVVWGQKYYTDSTTTVTMAGIGVLKSSGGL